MIHLRCTLLAACAIVATAPAGAHGDLHEQIASVDRQIVAQPQSAALHLRRAELHRIHREWDAADRDYASVLRLQPGHPEAHWLRARAWLESGKASSALPELDRYLARNPDHVSARIARARTLIALGRNAQAAADFGLAIERWREADPDLYLERRNAQRGAGIAAAVQLAGIESGIGRLGPVPALEEVALEMEIRAAQWDAALSRLDRQLLSSPRKERLHFRRGQVLAQAGRNDQAGAAFRRAREEIEKLPPALRSPRAASLLEEQLDLEIGKLGIDAPASRVSRP